MLSLSKGHAKRRQSDLFLCLSGWTDILCRRHHKCFWGDRRRRLLLCEYTVGMTASAPVWAPFPINPSIAPFLTDSFVNLHRISSQQSELHFMLEIPMQVLQINCIRGVLLNFGLWMCVSVVGWTQKRKMWWAHAEAHLCQNSLKEQDSWH